MRKELLCHARSGRESASEIGDGGMTQSAHSERNALGRWRMGIYLLKVVVAVAFVGGDMAMSTSELLMACVQLGSK